MKKIIITKENADQRIDKFLAREFFLNDAKITRGEIIRNIKAGNIKLNNKNVKPSYILKEGDIIKSKIKSQKSKLIPNTEVNFEIIYQDKNIIVINKPTGLQVHPGVKNESDTLVNGLLYKFPEIQNVGDLSTSSGQVNLRPGIVHRLDKDTSGIMLIARNQKTFLELKNKFKNREIKKTYLAIVYGKLKNKKGIIDAPLAKSADYKKQTIANKKTKTKIRSAITEYEVLSESSEYSLVKVSPKTGRTHQIRIHLFSIGHPITGDKKYCLKNIKPNKEAGRQLLHAQKIKFVLNGENFEFEADLSKDFSDFLKSVEIV